MHTLTFIHSSPLIGQSLMPVSYRLPKRALIVEDP